MKIHELYASVAELGFEDSLEDIPAFFSAANRAQMQINALRPLTAIADIYHRRPENLIQGANHDICEYLGEDVIYYAKGPAKAYYFEVMGEGACQIEFYNEETDTWEIYPRIEFKVSSFTAYRGLTKIDGSFTERPVRLRFLGIYSFQIRNVALWDRVFSSDEGDVPAFEQYAKYDLKKYDPGFIELCDNPIIAPFTRLTEDYYFENNSTLVLPANEAREIKIKYKKAPRTLVYNDNVAEDETEIDLDPELAQLMPLLVAAYIWADEGDGKSQYYLELYYRRVSEIEAKRRNREAAGYVNVTGW